MIIGCLGKGGSGKSTVATALTRGLRADGYATLAIDADHNMDLLFNVLGEPEAFPYLGEHRQELKDLFGMIPNEKLLARLAREPRIQIRLRENDPVLRLLAKEITPRFWLMAAGPHTEEVQLGQACSHVLASGLKLILPSLVLEEKEAVIVDSTAGMDMVGSGIAAGMDLAYIVTEPTIHATKTAKQIAAGLDWFGTPHVFVLHKAQNPEQADQAAAWLGEPPVFVLSFSGAADANATIYQEMVRYAAAFAHEHGGNEVRRARAIKASQRGEDSV